MSDPDEIHRRFMNLGVRLWLEGQDAESSGDIAHHVACDLNTTSLGKIYGLVFPNYQGDFCRDVELEGQRQLDEYDEQQRAAERAMDGMVDNLLKGRNALAPPIQFDPDDF